MEENTNKKLWFKAKAYGWGWEPASKEGWLVLVVYIVLMVGMFFYFDQIASSEIDTLINFAIAYIPLTFLLFFICVKKGEKPRWRWGRKKE